MLKSIWRSIFPRPIVPRDEREQRRAVLDFLLLHLRPVRVRRTTLRYTHTFGLGGMSLVLITVLIATGVLLMLAYEPSPGLAYDSVRALDTDLVFGGLVRNVHHWSANLLVAVVLLHMLRVLFTGGFHGPRRFNWVIGVALLLGVLAANFTGYLLPWDQLSFWAVTICTGMLGYVPLVGDWLQQVARGGAEVGANTLVLFFTFHTTLVPVALVVLMSFHFWRVRKAKGVVDPGPEADDSDKPEFVSTLPELLLRELAVGLALIAFVVVLSVLFNAPLGEAANPGMSPNPAKAPWYFVGFQELQLHLHPLLGVVIVPMLAVLALAMIPYLKTAPEQQGPWLLSARGRLTGAVAAITGALATPVLIVVDELWLHPSGGRLSLMGGVILPLVIATGFVVAFVIFLSRLQTTRGEILQALFILFLVILAVLTLTGVWFRGPGMALAWPWAGGG